MMAPPTPWAARARFNISDVVESPHTSDDTEKTPRPTANTSLRPNMSPMTPAVSRNAARVSE